MNVVTYSISMDGYPKGIPSMREAVRIAREFVSTSRHEHVVKMYREVAVKAPPGESYSWTVGLTHMWFVSMDTIELKTRYHWPFKGRTDLRDHHAPQS